MCCAHNGNKKDVIEPGVAAVLGVANLVCPLRWATLAQRLCASSTSMLLVSIRYAAGGTLANMVCHCCMLCFTGDNSGCQLYSLRGIHGQQRNAQLSPD